MSSKMASAPKQKLDADQDQITLLALNAGDFDFLDFGCSHGGSIQLANRMFGEGAGLGLDIDVQKVAATRESGHAAMVADLTRFTPRPDVVRYVMMSHMLEHLPGLKAAEQTIACGANAARDFLYIAQPWFDSDGYLFKKGLKLYWSDWHGHPNRMNCFDFHYILEALRKSKKIEGYTMFARDQIYGSNHTAIHPLSSPRNQHAYDANTHPSKRKIPIYFSQPVFKEIQILVDVRPNHSAIKFRQKFSASKRLFSSYD